MNKLFLNIETFYSLLQSGHYDHPFDLAVALETLSNQAWDDVDGLYPALLP